MMPERISSSVRVTASQDDEHRHGVTLVPRRTSLRSSLIRRGLNNTTTTTAPSAQRCLLLDRLGGDEDMPDYFLAALSIPGGDHSTHSIAAEGSPGISLKQQQQQQQSVLPGNSTVYTGKKRGGYLDQNRNRNEPLISEKTLSREVILPNQSLPFFTSSHLPEFTSVTPETVVKLIKGEFKDIKKYFIIDCRYSYEYNGGHIKGARSVITTEDLKNMFFQRPPPLSEDKVVFIFHCEYSSKRAPESLLFMRNLDRIANIENYPHLYYPELYLLDGGYNAFYQKFPDFCDPRNYISMFDRRYKNCRKSLSNRPKKKSLQCLPSYTEN